MSAPEVTRRLQDHAVVLWPLGATEQHGPHLATGFDHVVAETIVMRAAERLCPSVLVLPTMPLGYSEHWIALGGTISLSGETLRRLIVEVTRSVISAGAKDVVIVNGHAGNIGSGIAAIAEFHTGDAIVEFVSYWDLADQARVAELSRADAGIGHAGELETAIALHLPDHGLRRGDIPKSGRAVASEQPGGKPRFARAPRPTEDTLAGIIGDASSARAELGAEIVESAVSALVEHCARAVALRSTPTGNLTTDAPTRPAP